MAEWYYTTQGQQQGPVSQEQLHQYAANHQIQPSDMVWTQGYSQWVAAGTVPGLFSPEQLAAVSQAPAGGGHPVQSHTYNDPARSQSSRHDDDDDYEFERRRRRRRERRRESAGMPLGLKIGLIVGGCVLGLIFLIVMIVVLVGISDSASRTSGSYTVTINGGQRITRSVRFTKGQSVTITVSSQTGADVDLFVYDPANIYVASDTRFSQNCNVSFTARRSGMYRLELRNVTPFQFNRSTVSYNAR